MHALSGSLMGLALAGTVAFGDGDFKGGGVAGEGGMYGGGIVVVHAHGRGITA